MTTKAQLEARVIELARIADKETARAEFLLQTMREFHEMIDVKAWGELPYELRMRVQNAVSK